MFEWLATNTLGHFFDIVLSKFIKRQGLTKSKKIVKNINVKKYFAIFHQITNANYIQLDCYIYMVTNK